MEGSCPMFSLAILLLVHCMTRYSLARTETSITTDQSSLLVLKTQIASYILTISCQTIGPLKPLFAAGLESHVAHAISG